MKILYHHRTLADGAEGIHIAEMVQAFQNLGHEVQLIGPAVGEKRFSNGKSFFTFIKKLIKGPAYELMEIAYNVYGYATLREAILKFQPDFIYDRYITFNYSCIAVGEKYKIPVFLEVNAPLAYEREHEADETLYFKKIAYGLEKKICSNSYRTIVVSTPLKEYLVSIGVPSEKILVLPNGVNLQKFQPRPKSEKIMEQLRIPTNAIVIGFSGILRSWHGIDLLLKAFKDIYKQFPNAVLLLVGDGPIRNDIERIAKNSGFSNAMLITGRIPHEFVSNYVALFDIAVSPKTTFYASPMKIPEYMAQQKAVLAPDSKNIHDLITHEVNGYLFQDGSADSLVQALGNLISDKSLRDSLGKNAFTETQKRLNWLSNAQIVVNEYQHLLQEKVTSQ